MNGCVTFRLGLTKLFGCGVRTSAPTRFSRSLIARPHQRRLDDRSQGGQRGGQTSAGLELNVGVLALRGRAMPLTPRTGGLPWDSGGPRRTHLGRERRPGPGVQVHLYSARGRGYRAAQDGSSGHVFPLTARCRRFRSAALLYGCEPGFATTTSSSLVNRSVRWYSLRCSVDASTEFGTITRHPRNYARALHHAAAAAMP